MCVRHIRSLCSLSNNLQNYRNAISAANPPIIPYLGVISKDLIAIEEGNNTYLDPDRRIINFQKMRLVARQICELEYYQKNCHQIKADEKLLHFFQGLSKSVLTEDQMYKVSLQLEARSAE